ncbi:MAG: Gfo/Idh/MocA family oxidoreductase [Spirochaetes bacterium]|nr:Gfo/Idh/MocA family oxidoreductase [Spirochaetota bacterium]
MGAPMNMGIIGCGDFLRWMAPAIKKSSRVAVKSLFDPARERSAKFADELGGTAVASADAIMNDPSIDIVCLFVPPWLRRPLAEEAARAGKHILATKPLAASIEDAEAMVKACSKVRMGVIYGRSGDGFSVMTHDLFASDEIGRLALYRQDWLHHYPQWNTWALDPVKNGGPFMDAMIHNLNLARYLMDRPVSGATFFSDNLAHPGLTCADTEAMKVDFAGGGTAYLFITWAADLEVRSTDGNDREHIDVFYMVTDKGYRLTKEWRKEGATLIASREGKTKSWTAKPPAGTLFDRFAEAVEQNSALPGDIVSAEMAAEDIRMLRTLEKQPGSRVPWNP